VRVYESGQRVVYEDNDGDIRAGRIAAVEWDKEEGRNVYLIEAENDVERPLDYVIEEEIQETIA
jgi:hypothetical protein